jgi:hypothetical protein
VSPFVWGCFSDLMVPRLSVVEVQRTLIIGQVCLKRIESLSLLIGAEQSPPQGLHFFLHYEIEMM